LIWRRLLVPEHDHTPVLFKKKVRLTFHLCNTTLDLTYLYVMGIFSPGVGKGAAMETTATSKGQIVIPSSIRRKLSIKAGTRIQIELDEKAKEIILKPITRDYVHSLRGKFRGKGLMKTLMAEKKREREF
jgi:AbrB family looped-hinge helix DNA binding protein